MSDRWRGSSSIFKDADDDVKTAPEGSRCRAWQQHGGDDDDTDADDVREQMMM